MKTGLVLEGGGFRGIYTAGVLDVFMENQIKFDGVIGVSAGAVHGCSFLSNQKGRSIRYYRNYCSDPRFMSIQSWIKTGDIVEVEFCYHRLPEKLDVYDYAAFKENKTPFYVVVSNVETGEAEYIQMKDMLEEIDFLRASASLPYFSRIVEIENKKYLDGGCCDAIPVRQFQKMGFEKNVVVLTRPADYVKKPESKLFYKLIYRKYPKFASAMERRAENYNKTVEELKTLEKSGDIFIIRPETALPAARMEHDPERIQATYDRGVADGRKSLDKLMEFLGK